MTSQPKRCGPKPSAFQYAVPRGDGTSLVCYGTAAGPDGLVFAVFDANDLDIAAGCYPNWDAKRQQYRLARNTTPTERIAGRGLVRAYQLVLERKLGRRLDVRGNAGEVTDHVNGDPLDNRRLNLRALSHRLNTALQADVKAGRRLPGASYSVSRSASGRSQCWQVFWREPGRPQPWRGQFRTELEAHLAWRERFDALEPGALDAAIAAHPALLERLSKLSANANNKETP